MTAAALIVLEDLVKRHEPTQAPVVAGLSLEVKTGEIFALLGPSGSGKTTTLRLIAGFEIPDRGRISIAGRVVQDTHTRVPPERREIGFVFQDYALFPHLTVRANLAFGLKGSSASERADRLRWVVSVCELQGLEDRYPHELSGGEQQRAALGRAMAPGNEVVLLDEPLSNLDTDLRAALRGQLRQMLKSAGKTAILVTHDQDEAFEIADRVGVLYKGQLEQVGTPEQVYEAPASRFVASFVGGANFLPGVVAPEGIVTEIGTFANDAGFAPGQEVDVLVRPTEIALRRDPRGPAVAIGQVFRRSHQLYTIRLASGLDVRCRSVGGSGVARADRVAVTASTVRAVAFTKPRPAG